MNSKDAYKQKIEAELKQVHAKLAEFDAQKKRLTADARIKHDTQLNNPPQKENAKWPQRAERGEANKDVWDLLRYC